MVGGIVWVLSCKIDGEFFSVKVEWYDDSVVWIIEWGVGDVVGVVEEEKEWNGCDV